MISWAAGIFSALLGTDVVFKQYVEENIKDGEERKYLNDKLIVRKVYNRGLMLDALEDYPREVKAVSVAAGIGVFLNTVRIFWKKGHYREKAGMTLVCAGTASNLFDRLVRGKVIDYIAFGTGKGYFSKITANLGDFYIAAGMLLAWKRKNRKR